VAVLLLEHAAETDGGEDGLEEARWGGILGMVTEEGTGVIMVIPSWI
jgi:hypothetical protein